MPAPPRVSILKRDGSLSYYESYADARSVASTSSRDTIVIYADLDEPVVLKDQVDIWIIPGVVIDNTTGPNIKYKNLNLFNTAIKSNLNRVASFL